MYRVGLEEDQHHAVWALETISQVVPSPLKTSVRSGVELPEGLPTAS